MAQLIRRLAVYVGSLLVLIGLYTLAYRWGMATYEGESRTWYQALEIVIQSMTTTGYGQDAPWETLQMTALVLAIQLTGIAYILVAIPQFVIPWIETLVRPTPPDQIADIENHIVIIGFTDLSDTLITEAEANRTAYVVVESDESRAQELHEDGFRVLHGNPETENLFDAAHLDGAKAVVADATEGDLVRTVLEVEDREPESLVLPLVSEPEAARYYRYAGVDEVLLPKHRLGKALGDRVRGVVDIEEDLELGESLEIVEYYIDLESSLLGESLASMKRLEESGATALGAWVRGDFVTNFSKRDRIDENTSVLVTGTESELDAVASLTGSAGSPYRAAVGPVIVVGAGLVGTTASGTLTRAGLDPAVVDRADTEQVDVVGDATEEETLLEAGITEAETLIVTLESDDDAIRTVLTARAMNPDVEILVGANTVSSVDSLRTAGADYVLSLPNVAGRMVTQRVFEYDVMVLEDPLLVQSVELLPPVDTVSPAEIELKTGCSVVALERDGELYSRFEQMQFTTGDRLIIAGTEE